MLIIYIRESLLISFKLYGFNITHCVESAFKYLVSNDTLCSVGCALREDKWMCEPSFLIISHAIYCLRENPPNELLC